MNWCSHLILVDVIRELRLSQLVECNDDESHEDVDKEEREDDKEHDVENGHLNAEPGEGALLLVSRGHGVLQDPGILEFIEFLSFVLKYYIYSDTAETRKIQYQGLGTIIIVWQWDLSFKVQFPRHSTVGGAILSRFWNS